MRTITLTQGFSAVVDDEDYPLVADYIWHARRQHGRTDLVYACTNPGPRGPRQAILMHRLVLGLGPGDPDVDHRDGDGLNNQRSNLRLASTGQNNANRRKQKGSSRFKGVSWFSPRQKWRAQIRVDGEKRHLGLFADEVAAAHAYDTAAREAWGEFARTNFEEET